MFGSRSCCPKRFECPDLNKSDDDKCTFEGKDYQLGEILPRDETVNTKCVETCFCTRSACVSSSPFLSPVNYDIEHKTNHSLFFADMTTSPPNSLARTVTAACQASNCPVASTFMAI